jgi:hypothetical protein
MLFLNAPFAAALLSGNALIYIGLNGAHTAIIFILVFATFLLAFFFAHTFTPFA